MREILERLSDVAESLGRRRRSAIVSAESLSDSHHVARSLLAGLPISVIVVGRGAP
jgi:hypothetical protein